MLENPKIQKGIDLVVNDQEYHLEMAATGGLLYLELESKYDALMWKNTFTLDYIEELTRKTGNPKKFQIFINILNTALSRQNDNVFFEILTFQDLENMKQQKISESRQSSQSQSSNSSVTKSNKRYMILSYQTEFEKIHYPLALNQEEQIDNSKLVTKIQNLKSELFDIKSKGTQDEFQVSRESFNINNQRRDIHTADSVKNENNMLRAKVKRLEESISQKRGAIEVDQLIRDNESLQFQLDQLGKDSQEKQNKLEMQLAQKNNELIMQMAELNAFRKELTNLIGKVEVDQRIKEHIKNMNYEEEHQIAKQSKIINKSEKEIEGLNQQLEFFKKQDAIQKRRITQLENEVQLSMKKFNHRGVTDRLYSPYSNHSNTSKKSNNSVPIRMASNPSSQNASPNLSKNSRNSTQNSVNKQKIFNSSPTYNRQPIQKRPQQPYKPQQPVITKSRTSPVAQRSPIVSRPVVQKSPIQRGVTNKSPQNTNQMQNHQQRQNYQQRSTAVPVNKGRTNYSAQNYNSKIAYEKKTNNINDLDNKINNLRNMLQKAKY